MTGYVITNGTARVRLRTFNCDCPSSDQSEQYFAIRFINI